MFAFSIKAIVAVLLALSITACARVGNRTSTNHDGSLDGQASADGVVNVQNEAGAAKMEAGTAHDAEVSDTLTVDAFKCQGDNNCPQYYYCRNSICVPGCEQTISPGQPGSCTAICGNNLAACRADHMCWCVSGYFSTSIVTGANNSKASSASYSLVEDSMTSIKLPAGGIVSTNYRLEEVDFK